jgi:hypothetical protein
LSLSPDLLLQAFLDNPSSQNRRVSKTKNTSNRMVAKFYTDLFFFLFFIRQASLRHYENH